MKCDVLGRTDHSEYENTGAGVQKVTLEQLIALNQEISALAAAGVPMSDGLARVASDLSGPTSALAERLARRLEQGETLSTAMDAEHEVLPESYRALVKAGLQSGRLTSALEGYTTTANRMAELRRVVGLAAIYPVILLVAIWALFLFLNNFVLPNFAWLGIGDRLWVERIQHSIFRGGGVARWLLWLLIPMLLIAMTWLWWRRSGRAVEASITGQPSWMGWVPGIARVRRLSCEANFADLLRLFVDQQLPIGEALTLAAKGSGMQASSSQAQELVAYVASGNTLGTNTPAFRNLPPLVRLAFLSGDAPGRLSDGLQRAVDSYHERAQAWAQGVSVYLPVAITVLVGGACVTVYAVLLLQPYVTMLKEIGGW